MTFLVGVESQPAAVINSTGTFIRFRKSQFPLLPAEDRSVRVLMPDGETVRGLYKSTAAFPYVHGPEVVHWIKAWLPYGETRKVVVTQERSRIKVSFEGPASTVAPDVRRRARRKAIRFNGNRRRSRQTYERWERDPTIRAIVLEVWGRECQVRRCRLAARGAAQYADRLVDVHHLHSVSIGGEDSPLNLCVLCVLHHALVHRGPRAVVEDANLDGATVTVNGITLDIKRDGQALMTAFEV